MPPKLYVSYSHSVKENETIEIPIKIFDPENEQIKLSTKQILLNLEIINNSIFWTPGFEEVPHNIVNESGITIKNPNDFKDVNLTIVGEGLVSPQNSYIEHLGYVSDDYELAKIYRSSHLLVAPSLDDNLPSTLLESLCCGTPVVAFDVGGISEIIIHNENGRLSRVGNIEELTNSINWIKQNMRIFDRIRICTEASKLFSADIQSNKILKVYQGLQKIKPRKTLR